MTYTKPTLNGFAAIEAIQSLSNKISSTGDPDQNRPTNPAYEADE